MFLGDSDEWEIIENDVWEAGFFLLWMIHGEEPWFDQSSRDSTAIDIWRQSNKKDRARRIRHHFPKVSREASKLLAKIFTNFETEERITITQVIQECSLITYFFAT